MRERQKTLDQIYKESIEKEVAIKTACASFSTPPARYEKVIKAPLPGQEGEDE